MEISKTVERTTGTRLPAFLIVFTAAMLLLSAFAGNAVAAKPFCGNNICEGKESKSCPTDCGDDPPPPPPPPEPTESCGCSGGLSSSEAKAGRTYVRDLDLGPDLPTTKYEVRLPSNYDVNRPGGTPVLVYLHGWGGSFRSLPASAARHAKNNGYIVVTPTGFGDGGRNSWNGFRSARLPNCSSEQGYAETDCDAGPRGPGLYSAPSTCVDLDNSQHNYCYDSCKDASGNCPKWDGTDGADNTWNSFNGEFDGNYTCYWTTCLDSVAQIERLLNEVETDYCVDRSMIWVTGCSNGGMFVYELAKDPRTSERFAGYLPQVGSPHPGFEQYRSNPTLLNPPKYLMGFWGESDTTVPGRENFPSASPEVALDTNFNGWLYMPARSIVSQWAVMNGLPASPASYDASQYSSALSCHVWEDEEDPESAEIVECFFQGGHSCPGFGKMSAMMWDFAQDHPKPGLTEAVCP